MEMEQGAKGIHSVDFKIEAEGHGCVNWNGPVAVRGDDGKEIKNHSIPKLRGFTNKTGKVKDENGYEYKIGAHDISLNETHMYVSSNCLRHHLFRDEMPKHLPKIDEKYFRNFLCSIVGLIRGYVITAQMPLMRKSALLLEDLVATKADHNFETCTNAASRLSETGGFYSKTSIGDTRYVGYGSINIEDLQFVSCDAIFGRPATPLLSAAEGAQLAQEITQRLVDYATYTGSASKNLAPVATYEECWIRKGACIPCGEAGILLNQDAIFVLVERMIEKLKALYISQGKAYLLVTNVSVDYNSGQHMRIKRSDGYNIICKDIDQNNFAIYYRSPTADELSLSKAEHDAATAMLGTKKRRRKKGVAPVAADSSALDTEDAEVDCSCDVESSSSNADSEE